VFKGSGTGGGGGGGGHGSKKGKQGVSLTIPAEGDEPLWSPRNGVWFKAETDPGMVRFDAGISQLYVGKVGGNLFDRLRYNLVGNDLSGAPSAP